MRMVKIKHEDLTLEQVAERFLIVKEAQHTGEAAMQDYRNCLNRFIRASQNSIDYEKLECDTLRFFSAIPDTSPARYNKPFQNVNALLNWMVEQDYIAKSPIKANKLRKRQDDGNIKPVDIEALQRFIEALDRKSYTGLRNYTVIMLMLDTGIRTKELLNLHDSDYSRDDKSLRISKIVAKTRKSRTAYLSSKAAAVLDSFLRVKPDDWEDWLIPNYEGHQLKVDHLDKSFAKHSKACGVKITPYQLRHSFATLFLKNGGDLFSLQHLMGHADLRVTRRYTELDEDYIAGQHKTYSPVNLLNGRGERRKMRLGN